MELLLALLLILVLSIILIVYGYLDSKRIKKESDARIEMYNTICIQCISIVSELEDISHYLELFYRSGK